jgi:hypothetical protein
VPAPMLAYADKAVKMFLGLWGYVLGQHTGEF